jgi:hypothetical protein
VGLLLILTQVLEEQQRLKHKLTPETAYFKAIFFYHIASAPKEELHQFLIGLYGEHILPATLHKYERLLRNDMYSMGVDANGNQKVSHNQDHDGEYLGQIAGSIGFHRLKH